MAAPQADGLISPYSPLILSYTVLPPGWIARRTQMDFNKEPPHTVADNTIVHDDKPWNAETELAALVQHDITPVKLIYGRNHGSCLVLYDHRPLNDNNRTNTAARR
jgi:hypothetical protein